MKHIIVVFIILSAANVYAQDEKFRIAILAHNFVAFGDYATTYFASGFTEFEESNIITRLYWRSPPAFCAIKAIEVYAFDQLFKFVYRKSKILGYALVCVCTIVRCVALKDNIRIIFK